MIKKINNCEVCQSKNLFKVLDLGKHPLCDDLIKLKSKKENKFYKIEILFCKKCMTAHQKYQINKKVLFPKNYHYRARFTDDVKKGMAELVNSVKKIDKNLKNKTVLDIGCNDGSLLNLFKKKGAITIGVEPTGAHNDINKKHKIYRSYFDGKCAKSIKNQFRQIDYITFTNVFAHISDLNELVKNLNYLITDKTILIIENHYLGSILKFNQFDTFYHEHPRTYSLNSFNIIAKRLKSKILGCSFPSRYGGNIRVVIGRTNSKNINNYSKIIIKEKKFYKNFQQMNTYIKNWRSKKKKEIENVIKKNGKLHAKAFPGRAAILVRLLGLSADKIEATYEKNNSKKNYHYIPGTRIPILPEKKLFKKKNVNLILNLAWHIKKEIHNYLKIKKFTGKIIDII